MNVPKVYSRRMLNSLYREIPLKDSTFRLLRKYFSAASNLYGIITLRKLYSIIESQNPHLITKSEFIAFAKIACHECEGYYLLSEEDIFERGKYVPFMDYEVIDTTLLDIDIIRYQYLKRIQYGKPFYVPNKSEFVAYADPFHYDTSREVTDLRQFLKENLNLQRELEHTVYGIILFGSRCLNVSFQTLLNKLAGEGIYITDKNNLEIFSYLYSRFCDVTRMQSNRGHTPREIQALNKDRMLDKFSTTALFSHKDAHQIKQDLERNIETNLLHLSHSDEQKLLNPSAYTRLNAQTVKTKLGRNSPCPCGSGRKFKNCCGK